ncbi:PqqD family protein [Garciella nitratireducens]|uniref:PqqD family protein n=1 Tax=Garciella nitratireducens TaxID=218205 RepID=UPI000E07DEDF|nr:PqqD family protein [Garciella nitratireducens]RBP35943.1 coenzyme PQQ synthesis protein D (PqqD) [Garciella nitratireducens]
MLYDKEIPKLLNIKWRYEGDGEFIIYQHPITGMLDILNPVASIIFANCDGTNSVKDICSKIHSRYADVDTDIINKDVCSFIDYLIKEEVLFLI